ncbi:MAG TPA: SDR family oxidoreductase [Acidobacteriota bacterium]|nr:SDR family oxidoreductase [Acidobacteriota bacterium]
MFDFSGKVALMAGGAGYLSSPACFGLVEHGAAVVVADKNEAALNALIEELRRRHPGAKACGIALDIGDQESIREAVETTVRNFGRLDILVNATYQSVGKLVEELTGAELDASLHLNLTGSFLLAREASRVMKSGGSIILFSSMYGQIAPDPRIYHHPLKPNPIEYGIAKAALEQMIRYLAVAWAPRNIRVNAIAPGSFPHVHQQTQFPDWMKLLAAKAPLGRIGRQEEVAGAIVFLASDEASYVTGHVLNVDGGCTIW